MEKRMQRNGVVLPHEGTDEYRVWQECEEQSEAAGAPVHVDDLIFVFAGKIRIAFTRKVYADWLKFNNYSDSIILAPIPLPPAPTPKGREETLVPLPPDADKHKQLY
jgi:hypothetical protein